MKSSPFAYQRISSLTAAVAVLAEHGDRAAVLAGGQSLLIDLAYRNVRPEVVLDINGIPGLAEVRVGDGQAEITALVRHRQLERTHVGDPLDRLLAAIAHHVAHPPIRARGTFVGSVAWAHPAAEWCALVTGLDGEIMVAGRSGERGIPAAEWFLGPHRTAARPDELITEIRLPLLGAGTGFGFAEHRRTHGSFAMAAAFATVHVANGRIDRARIGLANAADVPLRAHAAERVLTGEEVSEPLLAEAADAAVSAADPVREPHCSPDYRRQVLRVLTHRSLRQAVAEVGAT